MSVNIHFPSGCVFSTQDSINLQDLIQVCFKLCEHVLCLWNGGGVVHLQLTTFVMAFVSVCKQAIRTVHDSCQVLMPLALRGIICRVSCSLWCLHHSLWGVWPHVSAAHWCCVSGCGVKEGCGVREGVVREEGCEGGGVWYEGVREGGRKTDWIC